MRESGGADRIQHLVANHTEYEQTYRQWFSTLLLRATFSPISVHTGFVRAIFAKSALVAITLPPVLNEPMFTNNT